jgi:hypothetical protein
MKKTELNQQSVRQFLFSALAFLLLTCTFIVFQTFNCSAQAGIGINTTGSPANTKSLLDVDATGMNPKAGVLIPRMTTVERDAITAPIPESLLIFNTDTKCFNFYASSAWWAICGTCALTPTTSNAGSDQMNLGGTSTVLAGNSPTSGTGAWSIVSGTGGSVATPSSPTSSFSGTAGFSYTLQWTITTTCGTFSSDEVIISFASSNPLFTSCPSSKEFLFLAGLENTGGDYGNSVAQVRSSCSILAAGQTANYGSGGTDMLLVNIDTTGSFVWAKTIGGGGAEGGGFIDTTADGGYAIAGHTDSWGSGTSDLFMVKFTSADAVQWTSVIGTASQAESSTGFSIAPDGSYYLGGELFATYEGAITKLNSAGALLWSKKLASNTTASPTSDYFQDIKATNDNGCVVVGWSWSYRLPGAVSRQCIVEKFAADGTLEWAKIVGANADGLGSLDAYGITQTSDNGYVITANSSTAVLFKLTPTGDLSWAKSFASAGGFAAASKIRTTLDGGYFLSGVSTGWHPNTQTSRTFWKFNAAGSIEWTKTDNAGPFPPPNTWDGTCNSFEVSDGFLTVASSHRHDDAYAETNLCVEKFKSDGTACLSASVSDASANTILLVTDITATVQTYLQSLTPTITNPAITPVSQPGIGTWTDCSQ